MDQLITCNIDKILARNKVIGRRPYLIKHLQDATGLTVQGLLNLRSGFSEPRISTAFRIAWALRTNVEAIWPPGQFDGRPE